MSDLTPRPLGGPRSVVVVGAGLAGLRTAEELRQHGFDGKLTVVGAEVHLPYDRPPLSKELLTRRSPAWLAEDVGADLTELADDLLLGHEATALTAADDGAAVHLRRPDGRSGEVAAEVVVLACGAQPVRRPGWEQALVLHTVEDAAALRDRFRPGAAVAVVGAGWIGAEVAGVAAAAGCRVTVLEAAAAPLPREVGTQVGALTEPWYAAAGVDLRLNATAVGISPQAVHLADGAEVPADVVLAAVGARPATSWLSGVLPLTARGAVPVDAVGRVPGVASVRAVGDCAELTLPGGRSVAGGHWEGALRHPTALVADLLGREVPPLPAPYVFSSQLGHEVTLFGHPSMTAEVVLRGDPSAGEGWTALYVEPPLAEAGPGETDVPSGAVPRAAAPGASAAGRPRLVAGFTVDRPKDVGALRRLLSAGAQPAVDVTLAQDVSVPLRRAASAPG